MTQIHSPDVRVSVPAPPAAPAAPSVNADQLKSLEAMQDRAAQLELRLADINQQLAQLREKRGEATVGDRAQLDRQINTAQHDMTAGAIELTSLQNKIGRLERLLSPQTAPVTLVPPPAPDRLLDGEQVMQLAGGAGLLMFPIVLVMARNLWTRGNRRRSDTVDIESSPRLQRMEQAIESIAIEVERIGESQRFSTKLLSDRPAAVPIAASRREREPGTITPH